MVGVQEKFVVNCLFYVCVGRNLPKILLILRAYSCCVTGEYDKMTQTTNIRSLSDIRKLKSVKLTL